MKIVVRFLRPPANLGTKLQTVIHKTLDVIPMPAKTRTAIKNCPGCAKRKEFLDRLTTPVGRGPDHHPSQ